MRNTTMTKYEFLIRFSMCKMKKKELLKKISEIYPQGLPERISAPECLTLLHFNEMQKNIFYRKADDITDALKWLDHDNHHLITYGDINYPPLLKQIYYPPFQLFVKGNPKLLSSPQIAMVGSRTFSEYGAQWGRYFASELANNGLTITSGLALGIDAICHRGALDVKGKTIAVLGSGLSNISPKTNTHLFNDIYHHQGAIIAEFSPNQAARPEYFPRRNRIISGLSLGTFVVEATAKSGSLITARYALEQNRDIFALPGEVSNDNCDGTHELIKQGAYLVTKPSDILDHFTSYLVKSADDKKDETLWQTKIIHPEILAFLHDKPVPIDIIAAQIQQSISEIAIKLVELELIGAVKIVSGGYIRHRHQLK